MTALYLQRPRHFFVVNASATEDIADDSRLRRKRAEIRRHGFNPLDQRDRIQLVLCQAMPFPVRLLIAHAAPLLTSVADKHRCIFHSASNTKSEPDCVDT